MFSALADKDFRWFFTGYLTSKLGSAMAPVAIAFAVLHTGVGAGGLGWVMAARIVPVVLLLLLGGVFADRLGGRRVMIASDLLRCGAQAAFGALVLSGHATLTAMIAVSVLSGVGEGIFSPSLQALIPRLIPDGRRSDANALLSVAVSGAGVAGPALGGLIAAVFGGAAGPASVLFVDSASYAVSIGVLLRLSHVPQPEAGERSTIIRDLREGWDEFRSRTWLWLTTLQFGFFNALVWAPYLVLGPVVAEHRLGGAGAWGLVLAANSAGSIVGGLALLGRRPRRPFLISVIAAFGYVFTPALLASSLPLPFVCAAAAVTGVGGAVGSALDTTVMQQRVPVEVLGRITAYQTLGAFALGPLGLVVAGPLGAAFGVAAFLAFGAVFQFATVVLMLALPAVRRLDLEDPDLSEPSATVIETVIEQPPVTSPTPSGG
ncbi:major facilitator superfamily MFS_1 [Catenulispora acidiphila DSM 44928]|uniref:Major facilitator superfamily MFS_1 n=1 Tax=Catenulispora acidiphila (strain DSM 44928 / JCM 14897 / NBRC 102108 / NRRL B-24433 / ID139908) TaxID=479433 RepID=C7Q6N2_CATAD|nr:MFS transporter [Catenulispora acidiphila]ACU74067.1 major facilitator superfamily MFS_1 [Catenulispora acidiphila DSM 44928]